MAKKKAAKKPTRKASRSGAYQTQKGGPILNSRDSWLADPFSKTADKVVSAIKKKKKARKGIPSARQKAQRKSKK